MLVVVFIIIGNIAYFGAKGAKREDS